jgi:aryl-alcohol dehydrogenase-like predicted oxidoreductase
MPDYIRSAINNSLERLQTDYIDLYYCHNFTGEIPIEEVTSILAEFVKYVIPTATWMYPKPVSKSS